MAGTLTFPAGRAPQEFIFCGICDDHFMTCGCTGLGYGKNYIFRLPPPPPNLPRIELLRRFCDIVAVSPATRSFDARAYHAGEAAAICASIAAREAQLRQMMADYIAQLPTDQLLNGLARAAGGDILAGQPSAVQVTVIANECRAAIGAFISGDWSTITRLGSSLIQNAFQVSDPATYPLTDPHLTTIFQSGVAILTFLHELAFSDIGYRLALECDRHPQVTGVPLQPATERDYLINNVPR